MGFIILCSTADIVPYPKMLLLNFERKAKLTYYLPL